MQKTEHSTRDHLLDIGEELSLKLGFTGMGLSKLLHQAGVPKGSFYHYFQSKEAFGVALLRRYNDKSNAHLTAHFTRRDRNMRDLILEWYSLQRKNFTPLNPCGECLTVKLSAEVCDRSLRRDARNVTGWSRTAHHDTVRSAYSRRTDEMFYIARYPLRLGTRIPCPVAWRLFANKNISK